MAAFLEEHGYRILEKNYRCRAGEIDLIAWHQGYLVFVEVKYRSVSDGEPGRSGRFSKAEENFPGGILVSDGAGIFHGHTLPI